MSFKTVNDSKTEQSHIIMPTDINGSGRLFGGKLIQWLDETATIVAKRHSESANVTTAAIDNLQFKKGAYVNDVVVIIGKITYVGRSSMEIRVDSYVEDTNGTRNPINRAYFTFVALDENEKPKEVPRLKIETETEKAEWIGAEKRILYKKQRKAEGF